MKSVIALGLLACTGLAHADTPTENRAYAKHLAQLVSELYADKLPMKLNSEMSVTGVVAFNTQLTMAMQHSFTKRDLIPYLKETGYTMVRFEKEQVDKVNRTVCSTPSLVKFINAGGTVRYTYFYEDGEYQNKVAVSSCK